MTITTQEPDVRRAPAFQIESDRHRQVIGWIGLLLPFVLVGGAALRPTAQLGTLLHSMSAYYYTSSIALLEGSLAALAICLVTYRGYPNKYQKADRLAAQVAAAAALVIAFFPTYPPNDAFKPAWWTDLFGKIHDYASIVMFLMFAIFCLWLFRLTDQPKRDLPRDKRWRDRIYLICGLTIVGSSLWVGYLSKTGATQIFWQEALAIGAFSFAFLVKGGAFRRFLPG